MQPYFDPTRKTTSKKMKDYLKKYKNGRQPKKIKKMEDDLKKNKKWKTTSKKIKKMEDDLKNK